MHRKVRFRRAVLAAVLAASFTGVTVAAETGVAGAASYPGTCSVYKTSTGRPGGGVTGHCLTGGPYWIQVVGLCQNIATRSSTFRNGYWGNMISHVDCRWNEIPVGGYIRIGSAV